MTIRQKGIVKLVLGSALFATVLLWVYRTGGNSSHHFYEPTLMALPGAFAAVGFIEFVTGTSFSKFAFAWNGLKGWQRGVFGVGFLLVGTVVVIAVICLIAKLSP